MKNSTFQLKVNYNNKMLPILKERNSYFVFAKDVYDHLDKETDFVTLEKLHEQGIVLKQDSYFLVNVVKMTEFIAETGLYEQLNTLDKYYFWSCKIANIEYLKGETK